MTESGGRGRGDSTPKKRVNSRAKGKRGELDLAHTLKAAGFPATRGQQRKGGEGRPRKPVKRL
ncbi:hypothetical protein [Deinococcus alpinitundrae]|uniref:hypothetical protein n=1 Tax=Deinococcus alpinitundrae TaxID=468913 RepID=UPI00137A3F4E|nr:hypothetical protein [Deinococcus alpinitundrae]